MTYTTNVCRKRACVEPVTNPQATKGFCSTCYLKAHIYDIPLPRDEECKEVVDSYEEGVIKAHKECTRWKSQSCNKECDACALAKYVVRWEIQDDRYK